MSWAIVTLHLSSWRSLSEVFILLKRYQATFKRLFYFGLQAFKSVWLSILINVFKLFLSIAVLDERVKRPNSFYLGMTKKMFMCS